MKNYNLGKVARVLLMIPCLVFLVNCSKSKDNNNSAYRYNTYGQCVNAQGQVVQSNLCQTNGNNGGYYLSGNQCYNQQGQPVAYTYCQNYTGGGGTGYSQVCEGNYYYNGQQGGQAGWVQCYAQTRNCSGFTLQNQSGQSVTCQ